MAQRLGFAGSYRFTTVDDSEPDISFVAGVLARPYGCMKRQGTCYWCRCSLIWCRCSLQPAREKPHPVAHEQAVGLDRLEQLFSAGLLPTRPRSSSGRRLRPREAGLVGGDGGGQGQGLFAEQTWRCVGQCLWLGARYDGREVATRK